MVISSTELVDVCNNSNTSILRSNNMSHSLLKVVPIVDIDKDASYPPHLAHKICTIQFSQTMFDRDEQHRQIFKMISEFPSIRRIVLFHDFSDKQKGLSKDHYHGFVITSNFGALFRKYGARRGRSWNDGDLRLWMRSCKLEDTPHIHHGYDIYIRKYKSVSF